MSSFQQFNQKAKDSEDAYRNDGYITNLDAPTTIK